MNLDKAFDIRVLMLKHMQEQLTPEEESMLKAWMEESARNRQLFESFADEEVLNKQLKAYYDYRAATDHWKAFERWQQSHNVTPLPVRRTTWWRYAAAACLLMVMSVAGFLWLKPSTQQVAQTTSAAKNATRPVPPGKDGAVLTLGDGTQIVLDSAVNGQLAEEGKTTIVHKDGQISYRESSGQADKVVYNTMSTPRGRQYKLLLSDGTAIWLNAASSVTYPTLFTGNTREINITGEVYITAAHDKSKPFIVQVGNTGTRIEVLGTAFAINAYPDEPSIKTTLLEGAIQLTAPVKGKTTNTVLQPGEQTRTTPESLTLIKEADTEEAIAFVNGYFSFRQSDIRSVMRQLEKWYDLEVRFSPTVSSQTFQGEIQRNLPLETVLTILGRNGFEFTIDGNRVEVK